jgi:hydrogenase large subunit
MPTISTIDPVTRLEGHLKVEVSIDTVNGVQQVVDAWTTGTLFRGFEALLIGRDPWDAQQLTQRVCGVCPVSHAMASVLAQEAAYGITAPTNARIMRNLVLGANFLQSHILHFYHLSAQDYVDGPNMPPWQPSWAADKRLNKADTDQLVGNYVTALAMRRNAHELGALFGGRLPAPPSFIPGGITAQVTSTNLTQARAYLTELANFISYTYLKDVRLVAGAYPEYAALGAGSGNLLSYGVFDQDAAGTTKTLKRGIWPSGATAAQPLNVAAIREQVTYSWYADTDNNLAPAAGLTDPVYPKGDAYSWLKAPRYNNQPYEAGALARMTVTGGASRGVSVMARHQARADESVLIVQNMINWVNSLTVGGTNVTGSPVPATATGVGLTEAPRGAIGHWLQIANSRVSRYQIVTPTCWNASPRDSANVPGPIEQALIGTPVANVDQPVEVVRVIHSFDPCLSCAVHVMRPEQGKKIFAIPHVHGPEETDAHDHCGLFDHDHSHAHGHTHSHDGAHSHDH